MLTTGNGSLSAPVTFPKHTPHTGPETSGPLLSLRTHLSSIIVGCSPLYLKSYVPEDMLVDTLVNRLVLFQDGS